MARRIREEELHAIEAAVGKRPAGLTAQQVHEALAAPPPRRTLQYRLKYLVDRRRLRRSGSGRWARYLPPRPAASALAPSAAAGLIEIRRTALPPQSSAARSIHRYVSRPSAQRRTVGYNPAFLDVYRPNETFYLSRRLRARLGGIGVPGAAGRPAAALAHVILQRLAIDLCWNSSRLEGNSYSLLETERLIAEGEAGDGRSLSESQMILNHTAAVEFLTGGGRGIGVNRRTLLSLHALLADNLLVDPRAAGRLRHAPARNEGSAYLPPSGQERIQAGFDRLLATASAIDDPFEQSFFLLVQLPYLQPFDDLNKRVSRLAANIPLIVEGLVLLTFQGVSRQAYDRAVLGVCELRRRQFLHELFLFAYSRSAGRYGTVRHLRGEPDPLRLKHRESLREAVAAVVRGCLNKTQAAAHIRSWSQRRFDLQEGKRLRDMAEREILGLHAGNCARYRINRSEFAAWRRTWA